MIGFDLLLAYGIVMVVAPIANAALAIVLVPRLGLAGAGIAALGSTILLAFGTFGYLRIWNGFRFDRMSILGTLLLFGSLAVGGALVGMRPTLDISIFLAKFLVGVSTLALMLPISLDQDERLALADQLGVAHVLGLVGYRRQGEHRTIKRKDCM
jgi:hypothetical protein